MAIKFKTAYGEYENDYTPHGSKLIPEYGYIKKVVDDLDLNGKKVGSHEEIVFDIIGEINVQEQIDSYRSTTEIKEIFKRYIAGDTSVITQRVGEYLDTVGCPETLLDAQLMMKNGDILWNNLPADMKEKYDNNVDLFLQAAASGKLYDDFNIDRENLQKDAANTIQQKDDEITELRKQIADMQKGVKYE